MLISPLVDPIHSFWQRPQNLLSVCSKASALKYCYSPGSAIDSGFYDPLVKFFFRGNEEMNPLSTVHVIA